MRPFAPRPVKLVHIFANPRADVDALSPRFARLARRGVRVQTVQFSARRNTPDAQGPDAQHLIAGPIGGGVMRRRKLFELLERQRPQLITVDDPEHAHGVLARDVAAQLQIPTVLELRRRPSLAFLSSVEPDARMVVPEPRLLEVLVDRGISRERIAVVAPSFRLGPIYTASMAAPIRATRGVGHRPLIVHHSPLSAASIEYVMRFTRAVHSRDSAFLVAVFASTTEQRELRAAARGTRLIGHHLVTVGTHARTAPTRDAMLAAADLVMFSGADDRWLRAVPSAMACLGRGRPVALRWDDSLTRLVETAAAGLEFEDDPEWAAFEAVRCLRQPYWRARSRAAALRVAAGDRFDGDAAADELMQLYTDDATALPVAA